MAIYLYNIIYLALAYFYCQNGKLLNLQNLPTEKKSNLLFLALCNMGNLPIGRSN